MKNKSHTTNPLQELLDLDQRLIRLLARRSGLMSESSHTRKGPGTPKGRAAEARADLEKQLWTAWKNQAGELGLDISSLRRLFTLLSDLPPAQKPVGEEGRGFLLAPRQGEVSLSGPAPLSGLEARLYGLLAALTGQETLLRDVILNDPLVELAKALNQAGAALHWDEAGLHARATEPVAMADKVIFSGDDSLNLFLLMAASLGAPGRVKFTGDSGLKLLDLKPVTRFLPELGTRLVSLTPGSSGVPARLEASGDLPEKIAIPKDITWELVLGLALCAPFYENGLKMTWDAEAGLDKRLAPAVRVLKACGVNAELRDTGFSVSQAPLTLPGQPEPAPDPLLSAFLLLLPGACKSGGSVHLSGEWPTPDAGESPEHDHVLDLARAVGLKVECSPGLITTRALERGENVRNGGLVGEQPDQDVEDTFPEYFPLRLAVSMARTLRTGRESSVLPPEGEMETGLDLAERMVLNVRAQGERLYFTPGGPKTESLPPWRCPGPGWALAMGLGAMARPGLVLANPGVMTGLMPRFWVLYNTLPAPPAGALSPKRQQPAQEKDDDQSAKPAKRRYRAGDRESSGRD